MAGRADDFLDSADSFLDAPTAVGTKADDFLDSADAFLDSGQIPDDKARFDAEVQDKIAKLKANPSTAYLPDNAIENIARSRTRKVDHVQGGIGDFLSDVGSAVSSLPEQTAASIENVTLDSDVPTAARQVAKSATQRAIRDIDASNALDKKKEYILGLTSDDIKSGIQSIPFSLASLGAYVAATAPIRAAGALAGSAAGPAGTAGGAAVGTVLSHGAGMLASGKAAYNMDLGMVLNQLYGAADTEFRKQSGRGMTPDEFGKFVDDPEIKDNLFKHGLAEAGFEAIGNLITTAAFGKALKPIIGKITGKVTEEAIKGAAKKAGAFGIARAAGLSAAGELATEIPTQVAQNQAEVGLGLQEGPALGWTDPEAWVNASKEVFYPTLITSGILGGGAKIASIPIEAHGNKVMSGRIAEFIAAGGLARLNDEQIAAIYDHATEVLGARKKDQSISDSVAAIRSEADRRGISLPDDGNVSGGAARVQTDIPVSAEDFLGGEGLEPAQDNVPRGTTAVRALPPPRMVGTPEGDVGSEAQIEARRAAQQARGVDLGLNEVAGTVQGRAPLPPIETATAAQQPDDLLKSISRAGGISREAAQSEGIDPAHFNDSRSRQVFGRPLFPKRGGLTLDGLAEFMSQHGYLPEGQYYANDALDLLSRALGGEKVYSQSDAARAFERDAQDREDEMRDRHRDLYAPEPTPEQRRQTAADLRKSIMAVQKNAMRRDFGNDDWTPTKDDFGLSGYIREDEDTQDLAAVMYDGRRIMGDNAFEAFFERFSAQYPDLDGAEFESTLREAIRSHEDAQKSRVPAEDQPGTIRVQEAAQAGKGQERPASDARAQQPAAAPEAGQEVTPPQSPSEKQPATPAPATAPEPTAKQEPAAPDRRHDPVTRKRVTEMSPDEMQDALLRDHKTGLYNERAYDEHERLPVQVAIDLDSLKWVNDNMGHESGDAMLRAIGDALSRHAKFAYRMGGDEFVVQARSQQEADAIMASVSGDLNRQVIQYTGPDGSVTSKTGVGFTYGTGPDLKTADQALADDKRRREGAGLRAGRGQEPPGVVKKPAQGRQSVVPQEPLATSETDTETPAQAGVSASGTEKTETKPEPSQATQETDLAGSVNPTAQAAHDEQAKKDRQRNGTQDVPMSAGPGDLFSDSSKQAELFAPMVEAAQAMTKAAKEIAEAVKEGKNEKSKPEVGAGTRDELAVETTQEGTSAETDYSQYAGRMVKVNAIDSKGRTTAISADAAQELQRIDEQESLARRLLECLAS